MKLKIKLKIILCSILGISYQDYLFVQSINENIVTNKISLREYEYKDYHIVKTQLNKLENSLDEGFTDEYKKRMTLDVFSRLKLLLWT